MLVLTRKIGQRIKIGEDVTITVVRVGQGQVRLGIEAPTNRAITREELLEIVDVAIPDELAITASPAA